MSEFYGKGNFRPVSAVNKLGKIKKNIIPSLITPTYPPQPIQKRERSFDQKNLGRIKSAHPLNIDRDKLMQENIKLKTQLNQMENEKLTQKREISNLEYEISQKDKIIENMMNESQTNSNNFAKASEMHLVINVKKQYKELKKEFEKNQIELDEVKKNIKYTKINELVMENKILSSQIDKLKNLYKHSEEQKKSIQNNIQDLSIMKEALSKQDFMLLSFQENCQKMESEIQVLNSEIIRLNEQKAKKEDMYNKLKKKLKYQQQLNEKLVMTRNNIQNTDVYLAMKNKYEAKMQNLRKDLAYYKDSNSKNERMLRELNKMKQSENNDPNLIVQKGTRKIYSSNPEPIKDFENSTLSDNGQKLLLLQSIYTEEKNEKEKLQLQVEELQQQLQNSKIVEPKIILTNSYSANNIKKPLVIMDYDYFSETNLNEFIYILLKNLEANKIDMSILESRVLNSEILDLLKDKAKYRAFIQQVGNNLCEILKVKQEKDQIDIHSFIKTFLYNNYIALESDKKVPEDFKAKLLSLFTNISFYSLEQRQELNKIISLKLTRKKEKFLELLKYFDENEKGFVSFNAVKKIIEQLNLKFKNDVKEYFIYLMKCFPEEGNLKDLKYECILKVLEETPIDPNENMDEIEANDEEKEKQEGEDDAIEITNEEYLNKVDDIIGRICKVMTSTKKTVDDYFLKIVSKSVTEYTAIRLVKLVDVLKEDFNIELSNIEIFCLFTKVKPTMNASKDPEDIEEIIDYDKLKSEIECYFKKEKSQKKVEKKGENQNINKKHSIPNDKLGYSDLLEHAPMENISKEKVEIKNILNEFMKKHHFSFERFVFPVHCMMKLVTDGKNYNRYLDVEFFKHFLFQNGILVQSIDLMNFLGKSRMLMNSEKINIDYLKYILSKNDKEKIKESDFILFRQVYNRPEAEKIKKNKEEAGKKEYDDFEDTESVKMIQKEINGDE